MKRIKKGFPRVESLFCFGWKRNNRIRTEYFFRVGFLRYVRTVVLTSVEMTLKTSVHIVIASEGVAEAWQSPGREFERFGTVYPKILACAGSAPYCGSSLFRCFIGR